MFVSIGISCNIHQRWTKLIACLSSVFISLRKMAWWFDSSGISPFFEVFFGRVWNGFFTPSLNRQGAPAGIRGWTGLWGGRQESIGITGGGAAGNSLEFLLQRLYPDSYRAEWIWSCDLNIVSHLLIGTTAVTETVKWCLGVANNRLMVNGIQDSQDYHPPSSPSVLLVTSCIDSTDSTIWIPDGDFPMLP